ncbi:MAG: peptidoglycan-associated lipoprotein Pal [Anderseniella sp.]
MLGNTKSHKIGLAFVAMLVLAGCSKSEKPDLLAQGEGGNSATQVAPGTERDFIVNVGDRIYFLVDQTTLTPEGRETLTRQAQWLNQYPNVTIQVEGHADERGTREYNIALSAQRSTATREFLISQGVNAQRIATLAYGKERPVALCDAESCWAQNRRAVTAITGGASPG